jgi:hypothetical protein
MLLKSDYSDLARTQRIAANKSALAAKIGSAAQATPGPGKDALLATIEKDKIFMATPMGQGLPSSNENPKGWTENAWTDPAFKLWTVDGNGLYQPPANYVPPPPVVASVDLMEDGTLIKEGNKTYEVRSTPFGKMKFLVKPTTPSPTPGPSDALAERTAFVEYIQERLGATYNPSVQDELIVLLTWLSKRV